VDPQAKDVDTYIEFAKAKGMEIKYVVDTHIQADHLSGGVSLAQLRGLIIVYTNQQMLPFLSPRLQTIRNWISGTSKSVCYTHRDTRVKASVC